MFKPAARSQVKLKLALTGPSGSGKTKSALLLAEGLVPNGRFALIDTENDSASLYADSHHFDAAPIYPPFTTDKYIKAIRFAEQNGYDVLIIDSLSHAWSGEGGLLQQKEQLDARGGNSYTNWGKMTPLHEQLVSAILHSKIHIVTTMRSKQDYVLQENSRGKQAPIKVGLAPVQREGLEYEFTVVLDIAMNHEAVASKDRTGLFGGKAFRVTKETGTELRTWLLSAGSPLPTLDAKPAQTMARPVSIKPATVVVKPSPIQAATELENNEKPLGPADQPQIGFNPEESFDLPPSKPVIAALPSEPGPVRLDRKSLIPIMKTRRWSQEHVISFIKAAYNVGSTQKLSDQEFRELIDAVEGLSPGEAIKLAQSSRDAT